MKERDRDVKISLEQYFNSAAPNYRRFIEPKKQYAGIIISNNGTMADFDKAIDIIGAKIREVLKGANTSK
jgi:uridine kinase